MNDQESKGFRIINIKIKSSGAKEQNEGCHIYNTEALKILLSWTFGHFFYIID